MLEQLSPVEFVLLVILLAAIHGCEPAEPPLGTIDGTVTFNGQPLIKGDITFDVEGARSASGRIELGRIVDVTSHELGTGVPLGNARVTIQSVEIVPPDPKTRRRKPKTEEPEKEFPRYVSLIPERYNNPSTSGLTAVIQPGENTMEFVLVDDE